jgi:hypothetical protein
MREFSTINHADHGGGGEKGGGDALPTARSNAPSTVLMAPVRNASAALADVRPSTTVKRGTPHTNTFTRRRDGAMLQMRACIRSAHAAVSDSEVYVCCLGVPGCSS